MTVYTAGTWDLFHIGHLSFIERAAEFGSKLIVGVSTDDLVKEYKGTLPVYPYEDRFAIIGALRVVTLAVEQTELISKAHLKEYKPDVVVIGGNWCRDDFPSLKNFMGSVRILPYTDRISSTIIKERLIQYEKISR